MFINQSKYCKELFKRFDMDTCKDIATPTGSGTYLDHDKLEFKVISLNIEVWLAPYYI